MHVLNGVNPNDETDSTPNEIEEQDSSSNVVRKVIFAILSTPGQIISFSVLVKKNLFRKNAIKPQTGKDLMLETVDELSLLHFGRIESFSVPLNNTKVCTL